MPRIAVQIEWEESDDVQGIDVDDTQEMSASEALLGFVGWLTSRDERTVMSASDDASIACDLVGKFCDTNKLADPSPDWLDRLTFPEENAE